MTEYHLVHNDFGAARVAPESWFPHWNAAPLFLVGSTQRGWEVDLDQEKKLRAAMVREYEPGKAAANWLPANAWASLFLIAEDYLREDPNAGENWKDAENQWKAVANAAHALNTALDGLGKFACVIRLDAAVQDPGLWGEVESFIPDTPGGDFEGIPSLLSFAARARACSSEMKRNYNGSRRDSETGKRAFLLSRIHRLLGCPARPWSHARAIAAAIHKWANGDLGDTQDADWKRAEKMVRNNEGTNPPL